METMESQRPARETDESVYSNFDHQLDDEVRAQLERDHDLCAQHGAWDFCGYIWTDGVLWYEEVWRYRAPVDLRTSERLEDLIADVNDDYGSG